MIAELRRDYHRRVAEEIIRMSVGTTATRRYPNFADSGNAASIRFAQGIVDRLGHPIADERIKGQTSGGRFEICTRDFLQNAFSLLSHIRPGPWIYETHRRIDAFEQYEHLADLSDIITKNPELASALRGDYIITPDIVVARSPLTVEEINKHHDILDENDQRVAHYTSLIKRDDTSIQKSAKPLLHASISCKWTIRSDRSQNARTEALNLIRNRKGHVPHIGVVTAEPLPTRIAALALGTGDLDCVYHFALHELQEAIIEVGNADQLDMLITMIEGRRLRDISDLPFDLAI